jgi:hypothetical protein
MLAQLLFVNLDNFDETLFDLIFEMVPLQSDMCSVHFSCITMR